jgi:hypothetical protein
VEPLKPDVNPANWMLDVSSPDAEKKSGHDFAQLYRASPAAQAVEATVAEASQPAPGAAPLALKDMQGPSQLVQFGYIMHRNSRCVRVQPLRAWMSHYWQRHASSRGWVGNLQPHLHRLASG